MKKVFLKALALICCAIMLLSVCFSCGDPTSEVESIEPPVVPEGYTQLTIGESNGVKTEGYGAQIDTHIYKAYNNMSDVELNEAYRRIKEMNLQAIRTQVFPEWFERGNDNDDYNKFNYDSKNVDMNSIEMEQLYRLLDFCEENGILVDLSVYGCCATFESQDLDENGLPNVQGTWLGVPFTRSWITSPKLVDEQGNPFPGLQEFAENVYALLNYILNVKQYTCVSEFSIFPEPNLSYFTAEQRVSHSEFVQLAKIVNDKLKAEGIRDKIKFSGPAVALQSAIGFNIYVNDLDDVFDKYTISSYTYDDKDKNETLLDYGWAINDIVSVTGKEWAIAEFGSKNVIDSANQTDIDTYDRALFLARYMISLANQGCSSMKYWEIFDMMYGSFMMNLGLWKFRNNDWEARPQYYTWSLITKYTEIGSEIYPITTDVKKDGDVVSVAYKLPDGKWTYMICNVGSSTKKISFVNTNFGAPSQMNLYEVRASKCSGECTPIEASAVLNREKGAINLKVYANSFVVLSEK
ncbi:MAG: hypothetical protein IJY84_02140 [Clostridia bacterium]|nr:hypothetical protein [Clostridia bacterium]